MAQCEYHLDEWDRMKKNSTMKILVTGGAGFIGSNIVNVLTQRGASVFIVDDFSHANFKNLSRFKGEVISADVTDEHFLKKLPKIDGVIHEAAITDTLFQNDKEMVRVNYNGFKNILDFCLRNDIKCVYASSAATYGDGPSPMEESQAPHPLNIYAYSKYLCDQYAFRCMKKSKTLIVGLRYFNVYGPGEYHKQKAASMIYQLYLQMKDNKNPRVFQYGDQKRDFIYVKDVARITSDALQLKESVILNVGTGKARSFNDIIAALNTAMKKNVSPEYFLNPYQVFYQENTEANVAVLHKKLKGAEFSLEKGILDYVENYLEPGN